MVEIESRTKRKSFWHIVIVKNFRGLNFPEKTFWTCACEDYAKGLMENKLNLCAHAVAAFNKLQSNYNMSSFY